MGVKWSPEYNTEGAMPWGAFGIGGLSLFTWPTKAKEVLAAAVDSGIVDHSPPPPTPPPPPLQWAWMVTWLIQQ